jgi:DNA-binding transcriptional LysR family regulator
MNITLNQLRVLCEVVHYGQFTRAAEALRISQPAVSKCIKDMERQIGVPLFEQIGRRVLLTEAGNIMHAHAERILTELGNAEHALRALQSGEVGRLLIGASTTPGTYLLPPLLGAFRNRFPQAELTLKISDTREIVQHVLDGLLDLGVVGEADFKPTLYVERIVTEKLVLILPPSHPLADKEAISLDDLTAAPFVLRERGSSTREVLERALHARGLEPNIVMELNNAEAVKKAVEAGLGISFVSEHAVKLELKAGVFVMRHVPELELSRGIYYIRRAASHLTVLHERFLEELRRWKAS